MNTEVICMPVTVMFCIVLVQERVVEDEQALAEDEAEDVVLHRGGVARVMSVNHLGPMRSMPQANRMRGKAR